METENNAPAGNAGGENQNQQQAATFTQADIDRIVKDRLAQQSKSITAKFSDYDDAKAKADEANALTERLGALEKELSSTKADALRSSIAARFGVSTEKGAKGELSDADLFLTGTDEATLTAQAQRLGSRQEDRKKRGNVALKEGSTQTNGEGNTEIREFAKNLFAGTD